MSFTITYFLHITIIEIRFQKKTTTQLTIGPSAIHPIPESGGTVRGIRHHPRDCPGRRRSSRGAVAAGGGGGMT